MSCPALVVNNLKVVFPAGRRVILHDLSFCVPGGSTVALVGESGSGKTMASMAVMGLLPSGIFRASGEISIDDQPTGRLNPEQYRALRHKKVAMVMQNPMSAFDPVLSIFQHFRETFASHGLRDRSRIRAMAAEGLAQVGFDEPAHVLELYPFQMSGGMLQRVMLAMALIFSPPLVIADEATTDLDVVSQARVLKLLQEHCRRRHLALLLITHDLSVAAGLADEMAVLREGRLVEKGPVSEMFSSPRSPYTADLLSVHRALYSPRYLKIVSQLEAR